MEYVIHREGNEDYLEHYGTKGQKWGIRKYQNEDGSLTAEGKQRYGAQSGFENRQMYKRGTITREQYLARKKELKNDGAGYYDMMKYGGTRQMREFQRRHETGYKVASALVGSIGGLAIGAAGLASGITLGGAAVAAILGAAGAGLGYAAQKADNFHNRKMLDLAYNKKTS